MQALGELGGKATAFQIVEQIKLRVGDMDSNTITPRLAPLADKKLIERTEERGPGRNGSRRQMVWRLLP